MHPIIRSKLWLAGYIVAWQIAAVLLAALLETTGNLGFQDAELIAAPLCLFYAFVCMSPWYVARPLLLHNASIARHVAQHAGAAILACALWLGLAQAVAAALDLSAILKPAVPLLVSLGFLLYALSIAVHYGALALESSREAAVQAREAELRALKAQIHPHFLFNSLNSIAALTSTDPEQARTMAIRLSDFLRKTLGLGERQSIRWGDELDLARTYLEVEQIRFGSRLRVEMNTDQACAECQVPPLVLQPLIENAIRHGIATLVEGGTVSVESRVHEGQLEVSVENAFDPDSPSPRRHGHGLRNVRDRLETRFGAAARLSAQSAENRFRASMTMPCQRD